ncbi:hypothetical protein MPLDJ20_20197 [Mesorhizobium plurifarium]|uniref:HTH marR-type domain-containing protein n=1 Tax=Mesorhizobium plurifarium TaxID=69974 RepID=A0A090GKH6_MESPL|nr:hypothetical protein MPLSOD_150079 [Mesorhizobium sp. SOD10]CDX35444.1 hypothetical protein MPLDJ20_20197 [Mesorhizobium plurifarium]
MSGIADLMIKSPKPDPSKAMRSFSASLPMMLLRAREAVMAPFRELLDEHGLTEQQWRVFRVLAKNDEMDVTQLVESTYLLGPSVARILRDLENQKLIVTRADKHDKRRKWVRLAPKGRKQVELIAPPSEAIYAELSETFGSERLTALQGLLEELQATAIANGSWKRHKPNTEAARSAPKRAPIRAGKRTNAADKLRDMGRSTQDAIESEP